MKRKDRGSNHWTGTGRLALRVAVAGARVFALVRESLRMNKQELIGHVADRSGMTRNDAMRAVETMLEVITSTLKRGDEVRLVGFGNFSVTRRKASTGRNPRTGEPMQIKASSQPKFRPGKVLKDAVQ
ncbi:MAG: HU family DNA-binding protein [Gemmatimonadaceae bacterium]